MCAGCAESSRLVPIRHEHSAHSGSVKDLFELCAATARAKVGAVDNKQNGLMGVTHEAETMA